jgi:alpha-glucoside transport system permease protein
VVRVGRVLLAVGWWRAPRRGRGGDAAGGGRGRAGRTVGFVLVALCVLWLIPTAGVVVTSFRTGDAVNGSGWWTVLTSPLDTTQYTLANYRQVWNSGMASSFLSSLAVTLPAVLIPILIAGFAAYAFTFMKFWGRRILFPVIVALLVVPMQVALAPLLRIYSDLQLNGTYAAVYLAHIGFGMPLAVLLLRNFMAALPRTIIESAKIDGASHYQIFWRLVIPLSIPAVAAFAVFQFLSVWNDLLIALVFLGEGERQTVTMTLGGQIGQVGGRGWQAVSGAALIALSIPVLVFLGLQRYFIRGLIAGAVNG